mmetsp:Transcript_4887/g.17161  ORF Transcript_4887/g.17161 Transcript_4887/m.17161 type:complete len:303 (-) Transcript_4887:247-1155(-)
MPQEASGVRRLRRVPPCGGEARVRRSGEAPEQGWGRTPVPGAECYAGGRPQEAARGRGEPKDLQGGVQVRERRGDQGLRSPQADREKDGGPVGGWRAVRRPEVLEGGHEAVRAEASPGGALRGEPHEECDRVLLHQGEGARHRGGARGGGGDQGCRVYRPGKLGGRSAGGEGEGEEGEGNEPKDPAGGVEAVQKGPVQPSGGHVRRRGGPGHSRGRAHHLLRPLGVAGEEHPAHGAHGEEGGGEGRVPADPEGEAGLRQDGGEGEADPQRSAVRAAELVAQPEDAAAQAPAPARVDGRWRRG